MALFAAAELLVGVDAQAAAQNEAEKRKFADSHRGSKAAAAALLESFGDKMQMKGAISVVPSTTWLQGFLEKTKQKWHFIVTAIKWAHDSEGL